MIFHEVNNEILKKEDNCLERKPRQNSSKVETKYKKKNRKKNTEIRASVFS